MRIYSPNGLNAQYPRHGYWPPGPTLRGGRFDEGRLSSRMTPLRTPSGKVLPFLAAAPEGSNTQCKHWSAGVEFLICVILSPCPARFEVPSPFGSGRISTTRVSPDTHRTVMPSPSCEGRFGLPLPCGAGRSVGAEVNSWSSLQARTCYVLPSPVGEVRTTFALRRRATIQDCMVALSTSL